jgi:hypothetical protein
MLTLPGIILAIILNFIVIGIAGVIKVADDREKNRKK